MTSDIVRPEARIAELGIELPSGISPIGHYVGAARSGSLLFCSGHLPSFTGDPRYRGKLGRDVTVEQGYRGARQAALNMLASARETLGSLDHVTRIVKLFGMVNATEEFVEHPRVVDGASDVLHEIFGDRAAHARSAVGMAQLPNGSCVEVEAVLEIG